jgi:hypothetical protein
MLPPPDRGRIEEGVFITLVDWLVYEKGFTSAISRLPSAFINAP